MQEQVTAACANDKGWPCRTTGSITANAQVRLKGERPGPPWCMDPARRRISQQGVWQRARGIIINFTRVCLQQTRSNLSDLVC